MAFNFLQNELDADGILTLRINRPEKLNALNAGVLAELREALSEAANNDAVRALILTGSGEKAFIAGADIGELAAQTAAGAIKAAESGQRIFRSLETLGKPSIAAVNGFALGGGLELAMACTLRIASDNAKLGQPEVKLGILPGYGGTQRLPRLVGRGRALEMLLTGEPISAAEAFRIGLVNQVAAFGELIPVAKAMLMRILANGPAAIALTMQAVDVGLNSGLAEGLQFEAAAFGVVAATEDKKEGTAAFLAKRKAVFTGR